MKLVAFVMAIVAAASAHAETFRMPKDPLVEAVERGDVAATREALKRRAGSPDFLNQEFSGWSALAGAVLAGHTGVVGVLLEAGAKTDAPNVTWGLPDGWNLRCAARLHAPALETALTKAKAPPPTPDCLAEVQLIVAARRGRVKDVSASKFPSGLSLDAARLALQGAVSTGKPEVARAVIDISRNRRLAEHAGVWVAEPAMRAVLFEQKPEGR